MDKFIKNAKYFVLVALIFIIPFFFLNITQEYFVTNKFYLLGFGVLLLLLISTIQFFVSKKMSWEKRGFDNLILLFLTTMAVSVVFSSPNKIQALLNPSFGLVMMVFLGILYYYISRNSFDINKGDPLGSPLHPIIYYLSSIILSLTTIIFFFQPFKNITLPSNFAFLKNPGFSPVGSQLDLAILLGFLLAIGIVSFPRRRESIKSWIPVFTGMTLTINLLALFLTVYSLVKPTGTGLINQAPTLILPPFRLSWFAAVEILKSPQTALFGIGLDNFSSIFTQVKDFAYNQSSLWQINSFTVSRSAVLQIFTETGIFGLTAFGLLIFYVIKQSVRATHESPLHYILFFYLFICLLILPTSFIVWFLFFVVLAQLSCTDGACPVSTTDLSNLLPIYIGIAVISFLFIGTSGYFLGRSYASEYYFKKSLDGVANNNVKQVYDNQRQAIILNPYIERFRSNFSQTNLLIANNLAQKKAGTITEQDKQTITQAIQASIAEGKAVVALNPQKADGWQNLAAIYLNIINAAQGADVWTISAYQRAILADPQNPSYRVGLGGVYYSLKKYDDALRFFEQAISIKPDWPNANYNYAWANFQKQNYSQAVNAMQNTLRLLDSKLNQGDYEKVQKELDEFKKMLSKEEEKPANKLDKKTQSDLNLPTPPTTKISPKLELPKEASPEAK